MLRNIRLRQKTGFLLKKKRVVFDHSIHWFKILNRFANFSFSILPIRMTVV